MSSLINTQLDVRADPTVSRNSLLPKAPRNTHSHGKSQSDPSFGGATKKEARDKVTFKNKRQIPTTEDKNRKKFKRRRKTTKTRAGGSVGWFSAWFLKSCFFPFHLPAETGAHRKGFSFPQDLQVCAEVQPQNSLAAPTASTNPRATNELIQRIPPSPCVTELFLPCFLGIAPAIKEAFFYTCS